MTLRKIKLCDYIKQRREKFDGAEQLPIRGVSRMGFISPKQKNADTSIYNVFYKNDFVFNPARMELNSIYLNTKYDKAICSSLYEVFYVTKPDELLPEYLNLFIKRDEFARQCWFNAIGSARNYFRVSSLGEFEIEIPSIDIQRKFVNIYNALIKNQEIYESRLDDLKKTSELLVEQLKKNEKLVPIGKYITEKKIINRDFKIKKLFGLNNQNGFQKPSSMSKGSDIRRYKCVSYNDIVYPPPHFGEIGTIGIFKNDAGVVSPMYTVFAVNQNELYPDYLMIWLKRRQFMRFAFFSSCDSIRDTFDLEKLSEYKIPIPSIEKQKAIADIYKCYCNRNKINEALKQQIKNICSVLISGSMQYRG